MPPMKNRRLSNGQRWLISACMAALWLILLLMLVLSCNRGSAKSWPPALPGFYAALVSIAHADTMKPTDHLMFAFADNATPAPRKR
jgi:hypothetical protein